jgi:hypothetical protein
MQAIDVQQMYPIVLIINNNGEITYISTGYSINLGEQLLSAIKR